MNFGTKAPLRALVAALAAAGLASFTGAASAQAEQRITITGSSIKRIASEGALPIQVITRAEIERQGIVTAEQLVMSLSVNGSGLDNLASNADVVGGAQRGNNGATSANLRGQGSNATLILLNGRRVASHGLNGGQVDLNQIPMAAVERIEVLKDGASSLYGTDAIGGVINFILRTNYEGFSAQGFLDVTEAGGGNIYRGSFVGGFGNLDTDRFNVIGTLAYSDNKALRGDQRDFVNTLQPNRGLSPDTRGTPYATIFPLAGTLFPTAGSTPLIPGTTTNASGGINVLDLPGGAGCSSIPGMGPYDHLLWDSPSAALACAWDTGRAAVLQQPIQTLSFVLRGTMRFGEHQLAAEFTGSSADSAKRFSNLQLTPNTTTQQLRFPRNADSQAWYDSVFDQLLAAFPGTVTEAQRGLPLAYRWRCMACGPREIETETDTKRVFFGADGPLGFIPGWDYRAGILQATSESKSTLGGGYYFRGTDGTGNVVGPGIIPALNTGLINIFPSDGVTQTAAGLAALEAASARGVVLYGGKFTLQQTDLTVSGPVAKLAGGDVMTAVGVDLRTEKYKFNGDEREATARPVIIAAPFDEGNVLPGVKRDVKAVFAEALLPFVKGFEVTGAVRYDEYDGFGSTTNPKVSFRAQPSDRVLMRGSYGTGFRVPTFNQLYNQPASATYTGADLADPATCPGGAVDVTTGCVAIRPEIISGGKSDLGPEEAKMWSLGLVWEPMNNLSFNLDWWKINRTGTIQLLALRTLLQNYSLFPERFIRDGTGTLVAIDTRWVNAGETVTEGVEVGARGGFDALGARWLLGIDGTYLLKKKSRVVASADFGPSEIGQFSFAGDLGLRWKHTAYGTYRRGDWSSTLYQVYRSGYNDQVLPGVASGRVAPADWNPKVKSYTLYHLGLTYTGIKNLSVTGMVKNLLDTDPPFANNYDSNFGSGSSWEPRVADPRGRSYVLSVDYKFF